MAPSNREGEFGGRIVGVSGSSGAGDMLGNRIGEDGRGLRADPLLLELLGCREGDAGMLKLLEGRANGLAGRSVLIWLGRLTKGLVFSGGRLFAFVGDSDSAEGAFVGDDAGVPPRTVAGDALFCRRKGDCRAFALSKGDGREDYIYQL